MGSLLGLSRMARYNISFSIITDDAQLSASWAKARFERPRYDTKSRIEKDGLILRRSLAIVKFAGTLIQSSSLWAREELGREIDAKQAFN